MKPSYAATHLTLFELHVEVMSSKCQFEWKVGINSAQKYTYFIA